jgi:hypothetical protein
MVEELPIRPIDVPIDRAFDAAVDAAVAMLVDHYRHVYPAAKPVGEPEEARLSLRGRLRAATLSPRTKRLMRRLSSRFAFVRRLRVVAWRMSERRRASIAKNSAAKNSAAKNSAGGS